MCNLLTYRTAHTVDNLLAFAVLTGFLFNLYGLFTIYWRLSNPIFQALFIASCCFLGATLFYIVVIIYLRFKNTINTIYNRSVINTIFFLVVLNLIGFIFTLISFANVSRALASLHVVETNNEMKRFVKTQWKDILLSMSFVSLFYSLQIPLWYSMFRRVKLRTNGNLSLGEFIIVN